MLNIVKHYNGYKLKRVKSNIRKDIKRLEEIHTSNATWGASLQVNIELLQILKAEALLVSSSDLTSIYINTGFRNVQHLFDWTNAVINTLHKRDNINFDLVEIVYQRRQVRLSEFILTNKAKRYPIDALFINLSAELNTIKHHFDNIKDPRYADRSSAALNDIWADVFAIVEMLCNLGVTDEQ